MGLRKIFSYLFNGHSSSQLSFQRAFISFSSLFILLSFFLSGWYLKVLRRIWKRHFHHNNHNFHTTIIGNNWKKSTKIDKNNKGTTKIVRHLFNLVLTGLIILQENRLLNVVSVDRQEEKSNADKRHWPNFKLIWKSISYSHLHSRKCY